MAIEVNGKSYETDEEGYLINLGRMERGRRGLSWLRPKASR